MSRTEPDSREGTGLVPGPSRDLVRTESLARRALEDLERAALSEATGRQALAPQECDIDRWIEHWEKSPYLHPPKDPEFTDAEWAAYWERWPLWDYEASLGQLDPAPVYGHVFEREMQRDRDDPQEEFKQRYIEWRRQANAVRRACWEWEAEFKDDGAGLGANVGQCATCPSATRVAGIALNAARLHFGDHMRQGMDRIYLFVTSAEQYHRLLVALGGSAVPVLEEATKAGHTHPADTDGSLSFLGISSLFIGTQSDIDRVVGLRFYIFAIDCLLHIDVPLAIPHIIGLLQEPNSLCQGIAEHLWAHVCGYEFGIFCDPFSDPCTAVRYRVPDDWQDAVLPTLWEVVTQSHREGRGAGYWPSPVVASQEAGSPPSPQPCEAEKCQLSLRSVLLDDSVRGLTYEAYEDYKELNDQWWRNKSLPPRCLACPSRGLLASIMLQLYERKLAAVVREHAAGSAAGQPSGFGLSAGLAEQRAYMTLIDHDAFERLIQDLGTAAIPALVRAASVLKAMPKAPVAAPPESAPSGVRYNDEEWLTASPQWQAAYPGIVTGLFALKHLLKVDIRQAVPFVADLLRQPYQFCRGAVIPFGMWEDRTGEWAWLTDSLRARLASLGADLADLKLIDEVRQPVDDALWELLARWRVASGSGADQDDTDDVSEDDIIRALGQAYLRKLDELGKAGLEAWLAELAK